MKITFLDENSNNYRRVKKSLWGDPTGKIKTFAIISPENPLGWENSTEEDFKRKYLQWLDNPSKYNKEQLSNMKSSMIRSKIKETGDRALIFGNFTYAHIRGKYGEYENTLMIFNIPFSDAKVLAKDYGQESFFFGIVKSDKSTIAYYKTTNSCKTYKLVEITEDVSTVEDAEDFFSKFGFKYTINMREVGADVPEVANTDEFEESMNEKSTFIARSSHRKNSYNER